MSFLALTLTAALFGQALPETTPSPPQDVVLETSHGDSVKMSALYGKPAVLFYEDRDSAKVNDALKKILFREGRRRGLLNRVNVIAVANVQGFDFFPARQFALLAIRKVERDFGVPIYADWNLSLASNGWNLPSDNSTVMVLDSSGDPVFRHSGRVPPEERKVMIRTLGDLLGMQLSAEITR